jgi:hypothetical protein
MKSIPVAVVLPDSAQSGSWMRRLWAAWKAFGRKIGDIQSRLLLSVVYFSVLAPFGFAVRIATDPLAIKPRTPKGWRARPPGQEASRERALEQF